MNKLLVEEQLRHFFNEDIGEGDISSRTVISSEERGDGEIIAKEDVVLAGIEILGLGYKLLDPEVTVQTNKKDGDLISAGETLAIIEGPARSLLAGERVLLNILQRMSGIATMTHAAVKALNDETIRICDTRKTMPGLRNLDKYAVRCGGGFNHRYGLNDAVMLKENHIVAGGGIARSVEKARQQLGHMIKIEVETTNEREVIEAVGAKADVIMFDNATPNEVKSYLKYVPEDIITEASGGISLYNLADYQGSGVHYISLGCLTHSVKAVDLSFLLKKEEK